MVRYPVIRIFLAFLAGILAGVRAMPDTLTVYAGVAICIICTGALVKWPSYRFRQAGGIVVLSGFFLLGLAWTSPGKYSIPETEEKHGNSFFAARLLNDPVEKRSTWQCYAEVFLPGDSMELLATRAVLFFAKNDTVRIPGYGDVIIVCGRLSRPQPPANPHDFDYRRFLASRRVHYTAYLEAGDWRQAGSRMSNPVYRVACALHDNMIGSLKSMGLGGEELGIASAMILGDKEYLDPELSGAFADAGAVHILCVSGLHVGIIFMISSTIFSFIRGRKLRTLPVLMLVWLFALVTGLSPPVLRASVMFSAVSFSNLMQREGNIFNTIALSAFFLLLTDPYMILQPGFQLSYSAVLGIVVFQPLLSGFWNVRRRFISKVIDLTAVSISAQIGTLPFSLFYFQQFPNYFILSNLVVIPVTALIIYTGLLLMALFSAGISCSLFSDVFSWILYLLRRFIGFISELPYAVTECLWADAVTSVIMVFMITLLAWWALSGRRKGFLIALTLLFSLLVILTIKKITNLQRSGCRIYSTRCGTLISVSSHGKQTFIADSLAAYDDRTASIIRSHREYGLQPSVVLTDTESSQSSKVSMIENFILTGEVSILILQGRDPSSPFPENLKVDILVIGRNLPFRLAKQMEVYRTGIVVLLYDMSRAEREYWMRWCEEQMLPYHDIRAEGAYTHKEKAQS